MKRIILHELTIGRRQTPYQWELKGSMPKLNELESMITNQLIAGAPSLQPKTEQNGDKKTNENLYCPSEPPPNQIEWRGLVLDFNQQTICYKNNTPKEFSFETKPVKLLLTLFDHPRVLDYIEIAKKLNPDSNYENIKNEDVKRDVQFICRDLKKILRNIVKMDTKDLRDLIITKEKVGYKIGKA
jgi:hypothetical protein